MSRHLRIPPRRRIAFGVSALVLALTAMTSIAVAGDRPADLAEGLRLLREGDKLADDGSPNEAVQKYKAAFEQILPGMRKIRFQREVGSDVTEREKLSEFLLKEFETDTSPAELKATELGMKALGLIPKAMDLKQFMVKLYSEEVAAFYDPRTGKMHMIKEPEPKKDKDAPQKKAKPSFLEQLFRPKQGFNKDENKTVIAHELTHALADQNYDLAKMQDFAHGDDDRLMAVSALIEGEATLTMLGAEAEDWNGETTAEMPAGYLETVFGFLIPFLPMAGGETMKQAPPALAEGLVFPYFRGVIFCARLTNARGWKAIDDAYAKPPLSTEQILHPEKYLQNPDAPVALKLGELKPGKDWKHVGGNVVGEMQTEILLRRFGGKAAAAGWDGDRYEVFEGPNGKLGLVWATTWDSENDAEEFVRAYVKHQTGKMGEGVANPDPIGDRHRRPLKDAVFAIERKGADVAIVEGFNPETTEALMGVALSSQKVEKRHDVPVDPDREKVKRDRKPDRS